jgi:ubiquinone/menaquinone biosynthesis C-methylase UbiE
VVDLEEYRERSLDSWERFSGNWDEQRAFMAEKTGGVRERMVERLDPQPGETILELASGPGETGFAIAERLGAEGRLIMTDFAPGMVDAARRHGEELGVSNVEYRVLDAERMDLDDDSVDGVDCRFGYMLMADPAKALAETRRVLRDGGRLVFAVWGVPQENLWAAIPGMTMVELGHMPAPEPQAPGIFAMGDPERINALVTGAGFGEHQIEQVEVHWGYTDPDEHWEKTLKLAAPIADAYASLEPEAREQVHAKVTERVAERIEGDGLRGLVHVVVAT